MDPQSSSPRLAASPRPEEVLDWTSGLKDLISEAEEADNTVDIVNIVDLRTSEQFKPREVEVGPGSFESHEAAPPPVQVITGGVHHTNGVRRVLCRVSHWQQWIRGKSFERADGG